MHNKLLFSTIMVLISFIAISLSPIHAQSSTTRVRGNVYDQDAGNSGIGGLNVSVTCNGNTLNDTTDGFGLYVVDFAVADCPSFAPVTSQVTHDGSTQSQTVLVSAQNTATLDFYFGAVSVPEFGAIGGAFAALSSGGAFWFLRKKMGL